MSTAFRWCAPRRLRVLAAFAALALPAAASEAGAQSRQQVAADSLMAMARERRQ